MILLIMQALAILMVFLFIITTYALYGAAKDYNDEMRNKGNE